MGPALRDNQRKEKREQRRDLLRVTEEDTATTLIQIALLKKTTCGSKVALRQSQSAVRSLERSGSQTQQTKPSTRDLINKQPTLTNGTLALLSTESYRCPLRDEVR